MPHRPWLCSGVPAVLDLGDLSGQALPIWSFSGCLPWKRCVRLQVTMLQSCSIVSFSLTSDLLIADLGMTAMRSCDLLTLASDSSDLIDNTIKLSYLWNEPASPCSSNGRNLDVPSWTDGFANTHSMPTNTQVQLRLYLGRVELQFWIIFQMILPKCSQFAEATDLLLAF